jgi:phosphate transport system substrate-binding protein
MSGMTQKAALGLAIAFWAANGIAHAEVIRVGGTGAAQGILHILGEAFSAGNPGHTVEVVPGLGSSGGIAAAADGALTLAVTSRALRQEERAMGLDDGPFIETPFIFVTSNAANVTLTKENIVAIHDGTLTRWADNKEIKPILRPRSDTTSSFLIANFVGMQPAMEKLRQRPDVPVAATDQDNLQIAEKIVGSFTAMTLIQFVTERPRLHAIMLDGIEPSVENLQAGKYSLKMALTFVTGVQNSTIAQRFIAFTGSPQAQKLVRESGGIPVSTRGTAMK